MRGVDPWPAYPRREAQETRRVLYRCAYCDHEWLVDEVLAAHETNPAGEVVSEEWEPMYEPSDICCPECGCVGERA